MLVFDGGEGEGAATAGDGLITPAGIGLPVAVPVAVEVDAVGVEAASEGVVGFDVGGGKAAGGAGDVFLAVGVGRGDDGEGDMGGDTAGVSGKVIDYFIGEDDGVPFVATVVATDKE